MLEIADSVTHIAPLLKETAPNSSLGYSNDKIRFISLKPSGGKGIKKLSILFTLPYNLFKICELIN